MSSPKSTAAPSTASSSSSSKNNIDCESGDEVDDIPESDSAGAGGGETVGGCIPEHNKSGSTTESYSSVLQDDEVELLFKDISNGNHVMLSPTDSESFTTSEQLTQRFVDIMYVAERRSSSDGAEGGAKIE